MGTVAVVGLAGFFYFRWVHGIPNLYQPTIEFIKHSSGADPLKSPRHEWLGRFTWLFVPPLVLVVAAVASLRSSSRLDRLEWMAVGLSSTQYLVQWFDQFVRNGDGLEISYYWSMSFPSLGIALALLIGRLAADITPTQTAAFVAGWLALLTVGVPDALRLPSGVGFAAVAVIIVIIVAAGLSRFAVLSTVLFVVFIAWMQIGAPLYDPVAYHFFNASARYDKLFGADGDEAEAIYREVVWFETEMDLVPRDSEAIFLPVGGMASPIVGLYHPHVTGQLANLAGETMRLEPRDRIRLLASNSPELVIYGPPEDVSAALELATADLGLDPPVFDRTHDRDLGYRLVVVDLPRTPRLPLTIEASELPAMQGLLDGDDLVVGEGSPPGFATFGPYLALAAGRYEVSIGYSSSLPATASAGIIDVFTVEEGSIATAPLTGTTSSPGSISVSFEVTRDGDLWEFRTQVNGSGELVIDWITIAQG